MRKEAIETGKTVPAAIEAACERLGYKREECEFEILDLPKKSLFGLKTTPAKVRVWIDLPEEKPRVRPQEQVREREERPRRESRPQASRQQAAEKREQPAVKPRREERPQEQPKLGAPQPVVRAERTQQQGEIVGIEAKETLVKEYIDGILTAMKLDNETQIVREDGGICVKIKGKGLGVMIGRRGETLDAIQYLAGLVVNRLDGDYLRVTIDCGDYRVKRQETLKELAKRVAEQVLRTDISKTLEPMNPFERRIIHSTVSEIEGVSSISIGEEPNRRVVITTPTAKRPARPEGRGDRPVRGDRGGRPRDDGGRDRSPGGYGGRGDRGRRDGGGRGGPRPPRADRTPQIIPETPKATPESETSGPLYAKIDLD